MNQPRSAGDIAARVLDVARRQPPIVEPRVEPVIDDAEAAAIDAEWRARRWQAVAPSRFRDADLAGLSDEIRSVVVAWVDLESPRPNLLLAGPVGTGKTWAACAAARPLVERGAVCQVMSVVDVLDALRAEMQPGAATGAFDRLTELDVLVLDDVGAERPTEWSGERLHALIDRRWRDELPIIATTNLEPRALADAMGERTYSRLVGGATAVRISGDDRRRRRPTQGDIHAAGDPEVHGR